jgi:hypothetical protein
MAISFVEYTPLAAAKSLVESLVRRRNTPGLSQNKQPAPSV